MSIMVQFMCAQWFPASTTRPRSATTFRTLKLFHALTMQGKVNSYDFYNGIRRLTSSSGTRETKVRQSTFLITHIMNFSFRIATRNLCAPFGSSVIFAWRSVLDVHTTHKALRRHKLASLLCAVLHVRSLELTCPTVGLMLLKTIST